MEIPQEFSANNEAWTRGKQIGSGGSSVVFRCSSSSGEACVKFFTGTGFASRAARFLRTGDRSDQLNFPIGDMAKREAEITCEREAFFLRQLDSKFTPKLIHAGEINELPYIIMSMIKGKTFDKWIKSCSTWDQCYKGIASIANILTELDERGICHLDIKEDNIIIDTASNRSTLLDFALAINRDGLNTDSLTLLAPTGRIEELPADRQASVYLLQEPSERRTARELFDSVSGWFDFSGFLAILNRNQNEIERCAGVNRASSVKRLINDSDLGRVPDVAAFLYAWDSLNLPRTLFPQSAFDKCRTLRVSRESVPLLSEAENILDRPEFGRLHGVKQLGMVDLVYRGATHTRHLHSVDTYRHALNLMDILMKKADHGFLDIWSPELATQCALVCLVHDLNHVHFLHVLQESSLWEDMKKVQEPSVLKLLLNGETGKTSKARSIAATLEEIGIGDQQRQFIQGSQLARPLQEGDVSVDQLSFIRSLINSGADLDKISYLLLDSAYTGVSYGQSVDVNHLFDGATVARTDVGATLAFLPSAIPAIEALVAARYLNFETIYWHHTHRAYMAMLNVTVESSFSSGKELLDFLKNGLYDDQRAWIHKLNEIFEAINGCQSPLVDVDIDRSGLYRRLISLHSPEYRPLLQSLNRATLTSESKRLFTENLGQELHLAGLLKRKPSSHELVVDKVSREVSCQEPIYIKQGSQTVELSKISKSTEHYALKHAALSETVRIFASPKILIDEWSKAMRSDRWLDTLGAIQRALTNSNKDSGDTD